MEKRKVSRDKVKKYFMNNLTGWKDVVANDFNSMISPMLELTHKASSVKFRFSFESSVPVKVAELIKFFFKLCPACKIKSSLYSVDLWQFCFSYLHFFQAGN